MVLMEARVVQGGRGPGPECEDSANKRTRSDFPGMSFDASPALFLKCQD